jgi:RimJ/RimL family protein N-acetyltransferase
VRDPDQHGGRRRSIIVAKTRDALSVENAASERVAERCGYVREGVMRSIHVKQDVRVDAAIWSRLPSDPA